MEGKSFSYIIGLCVGIFVAILVLSLLRKRRGGASNEYDERQVMVRGKAFNRAFLTLMLYLLADAGVCVLWQPWAMPGVSNILGIFLAIGVFLVVAIRGDAYFSLQEKPRTFRLLCLVVIFCQMPNIIMTIRDPEESFLTDGRLNENCLAVGCIVVFAVALVSIWLHEKQQTEEDGEDA